MSLSIHQSACTEKNKRCAGLNCSNIGIYNLRIRLINKTGKFCSECKLDLIKHNLAEPNANPDYQNFDDDNGE